MNVSTRTRFYDFLISRYTTAVILGFPHGICLSYVSGCSVSSIPRSAVTPFCLASYSGILGHCCAYKPGLTVAFSILTQRPTCYSSVDGRRCESNERPVYVLNQNGRCYHAGSTAGRPYKRAEFTMTKQLIHGHLNLG